MAVSELEVHLGLEFVFDDLGGVHTEHTVGVRVVHRFKHLHEHDGRQDETLVRSDAHHAAAVQVGVHELHETAIVAAVQVTRHRLRKEQQRIALVEGRKRIQLQISKLPRLSECEIIMLSRESVRLNLKG